MNGLTVQAFLVVSCAKAAIFLSLANILPGQRGIGGKIERLSKFVDWQELEKLKRKPNHEKAVSGSSIFFKILLTIANY